MAFDARFEGVCSECGERIHVGDKVTYIDGSIAHLDCEDASWPGRKPEVCPECWLTMPCGCEDQS